MKKAIKGTINPEVLDTDKEIRKAIGGKIRMVRDRTHHSAAVVAQRLGVSREALTHIETGRNNISATSLWKLATLFACGVQDFFPEVPDGFALSPMDTKLLAQEDNRAAKWAEELFKKKK